MKLVPIVHYVFFTGFLRCFVSILICIPGLAAIFCVFTELSSRRCFLWENSFC